MTDPTEHTPDHVPDWMVNAAAQQPPIPEAVVIDRCPECGAPFPNAGTCLTHVSLDHHGNPPETYELVGFTVEHGVAVGEEGTMPVLSLTMLGHYDRATDGSGGGMQLVHFMLPVEHADSVARLIQAEASPERQAEVGRQIMEHPHKGDTDG